jgi:hypothetical protein
MQTKPSALWLGYPNVSIDSFGWALYNFNVIHFQHICGEYDEVKGKLE